MRGEELPEGLSLPDQMAYTCLRQIYASYYSKTISRGRAAAEKQRVRLQWDQLVSEMELGRKLTAYHVLVIRGSEAAKAACRKDPTPENALQLCNVLGGLSADVT